MKQVVIAPDSFKGSLTAREAAEAIQRGIAKADPACRTKLIPMADGGEGTADCLITATGGWMERVIVRDPLGREIESGYGVLGDAGRGDIGGGGDGSGKVCVIELALSSGLYLIQPHERNPLRTTSYGFGQLIRAALDQGCRTMIVALGGSATNDGGAGMLQALGVELLDADGQEIGYGGSELARIAEIRTDRMDSRLRECEIIVACDVDNPFVGPRGASAVFGPQKGATEEMVEVLDRSLSHFADVIEGKLGTRIHDVPGAGAAGGAAGAMLAFLGGKLESGVSLVARYAGLDAAIEKADLVITGEGRIDGQTAGGKTPLGVAKAAKLHGVPVIVLAGSIGEGIESLYEQGVTAVFSMVNGPMSLEEAMAGAGGLLEQSAEQVMRAIGCSR